MSRQTIAAIVAVCVISLLMVFQVLLAVGLPLGRAAWGGQHRILPAGLRWGSLAAVLLLALAGWIVLARAGLVAPGPGVLWVKVLTWIFAAYFALNTVMNVASKSSIERAAMTPVSAILVVCFVLASIP